MISSLRRRWLRYWWRLRLWLDSVLPLQCPVCGDWPQKRTMVWARHHVAGWVRICRTCHRDLYGGD